MDALPTSRYATRVQQQGYITSSALTGYLPLSGGTMTGDLHLGSSAGVSPFIYFGDSSYVYIGEDADDHLTIKGNKGVGFYRRLRLRRNHQLCKHCHAVVGAAARLPPKRPIRQCRMGEGRQRNRRMLSRKSEALSPSPSSRHSTGPTSPLAVHRTPLPPRHSQPST